jgi:hypothetical protein
MRPEDVGKNRELLRSAAFRKLFLDDIKGDRELTLERATRLLRKYNKSNRLLGRDALTIEEILDATFKGDLTEGDELTFIYGPRATSVMAELVLQNQEKNGNPFARAIGLTVEIAHIANSEL